MLHYHPIYKYDIANEEGGMSTPFLPIGVAFVVAWAIGACFISTIELSAVAAVQCWYVYSIV